MDEAQHSEETQPDGEETLENFRAHHKQMQAKNTRQKSPYVISIPMQIRLCVRRAYQRLWNDKASTMYLQPFPFRVVVDSHKLTRNFTERSFSARLRKLSSSVPSSTGPHYRQEASSPKGPFSSLQSCSAPCSPLWRSTLCMLNDRSWPSTNRSRSIIRSPRPSLGLWQTCPSSSA